MHNKMYNSYVYYVGCDSCLSIPSKDPHPAGTAVDRGPIGKAR